MSTIHRFRCPECSDRDEIDITAQIDVRVTDQGTDADDAADTTHFWESHFPARCGACGFAGDVFHFEPEEGPNWIEDAAANPGGAA